MFLVIYSVLGYQRTLYRIYEPLHGTNLAGDVDPTLCL